MHYIENGYIKPMSTGKEVSCYWTHNHRKDFGPFSLTEARLSD